MEVKKNTIKICICSCCLPCTGLAPVKNILHPAMHLLGTSAWRCIGFFSRNIDPKISKGKQFHLGDLVGTTMSVFDSIRISQSLHVWEKKSFPLPFWDFFSKKKKINKKIYNNYSKPNVPWITGFCNLDVCQFLIFHRNLHPIRPAWIERT